jgi:MYXO-CTERM domain-containing protein
VPLIGLVSAALAAPVAWVDASDRLAGAVHSARDGSGYGGVALFDVDGDGDLDIYLTNGPGRPNALFRNDGAAQFEEVAVASGAAVGTGSRSVLAADLDDDGDVDLVLPGDLQAPLVVLRNLGDGTFDDVSARSGLTGDRRNTSAHAGDLDGDGWLDVYVTGGARPGQVAPNTLWLNQQDGTFREASAAAGLSAGLGACAATLTHLDDDAHLDILVANCAQIGFDLPFELWAGRGDGTFADLYPASQAWALGHWMGLAVADFDGDGRLDFFATNSGVARDLPHALYLAQADGTWGDVGVEAGVADGEFGWGTVAEDFDADGNVDLYYVGRSQTGDWCASPGALHYGRGDGTFDPPEVPVDLSTSWTSGLAAGDLDGNGFVDLVVLRTEVPTQGASGAPVLLLNQGNGGHWISVALEGPPGNSAGIGARVRLVAGDRRQVREVQAGSSYLSTSSAWPTFGLGEAVEAALCVQWPDGIEEEFGRYDADERVTLSYGEGVFGACTVPPSGTGADTGTDTGLGSGGTDTAPTHAGQVDSGVAPGAPDTASVRRAASSAGCGCSSSSRGMLWPLLALAFLRRHRAPRSSPC